MGCPPEEKFYEEISDMNKLQHVLGEYLDDLNLTSPKEMRLVSFYGCNGTYYSTSQDDSTRKRQCLIGWSGRNRKTVINKIVCPHV
ncbi:dynein heavy chain 6, axonemal [Biomphalaria glabrata]|nr:dynein heavy chain 6, axonemal [Biomphalaria glabrata]